MLKLEQLGFRIDSNHGELARLLLHAAAPWAFGRPPAQISSIAIDERRDCAELFQNLFLQAADLLFEDARR